MSRIVRRVVMFPLVGALVVVWTVATNPPAHADGQDASYYMALFAYEGTPRLPRNSHTFAAFLKVQGERAEVHTISWMPKSLDVVALRRAPEPGVNLSLTETFEHAASIGARVSHWGPFKIRKTVFDDARQRIKDLERGRFQYKARDNETRAQAFNCIHAVSDLNSGGVRLNSGLNYGAAATRMVVNYFRPMMLDEGKAFPEMTKHIGMEQLTAGNE